MSHFYPFSAHRVHYVSLRNTCVAFSLRLHCPQPFDPSSPDAEASLDIQYMASVMQGDTAWYWTEADWQYEFVQHVASLPDASVPKVRPL